MKVKEVASKTEWESFITDSGYPTSFFQSWNWGDFQEKMGNPVLRLGFYDGEELFAVSQGIKIYAKRGKYIYYRNGPVYSWIDKSRSEFIIKEIKDSAEREKMWFSRISPHVKTESNEAALFSRFPISPMYDVDALDTWILDLDLPEEEILKNMRKSTRYEIRKAVKEEVEIKRTTDVKDIENFYPIYRETVKRQKWTGYSKAYIKKQFETFSADDQAALLLAKYKGKYIAASIFIYFGNSCYYHYSGSLTEFRKVPGSSLIHWENIKYSKSRGLKRYNFWGIPPENKPNHPWKGLGFFKMGFGGYAERWMQARDIPVSPLYWLTNLYERWQKSKKGY